MILLAKWADRPALFEEVSRVAAEWVADLESEDSDAG